MRRRRTGGSLRASPGRFRTGALEPHVPEDLSLAELTLRWILDHEAVSTVIPGTTSPEHVRSNAAVSELSPLSHRVHGAVRDVYEEYVFEHVHHRW